MINRLKPWVKDFLVILVIATIVFIFVALCNSINRDAEEHIERVSSECAKQGKGITARYTKEGDKFYICQD